MMKRWRVLEPRTQVASPTPGGLNGFFLVVGMLALAGCTRSVEWDEEVTLGTGEIIWVHRSGSYTYRNATGDIYTFAYDYYPDRKKRIEFTYRGRKYSYTNDAQLQLLAISPDGTPNLVTTADDYWWQWNHEYLCTRPSYVQLRPDSTGTGWTWPADVEHWLYGSPTNLLIRMPKPATTGARISTWEKSNLNLDSFRSGKHFARIEPGFQSSLCKRRA